MQLKFKENKCVSRTDTNPPFAFQIAFPWGTDFTGFLQGGSESYIRCLEASTFSGRWDIGDERLEMIKNSKFFRTFGPPCRNPLAKVDGSMPECAQVCALHMRPHLATLKENRNGRRLSCYRRKPQNWYYITHFLAHPVEPRDRWVQTHATVG